MRIYTMRYILLFRTIFCIRNFVQHFPLHYAYGSLRSKCSERSRNWSSGANWGGGLGASIPKIPPFFIGFIQYMYMHIKL